MCSISVEPMPSRISQPYSAVQRLPMSAGRASPALVQTRSFSCDFASAGPGSASSAAYSVGTP
jgi:hypothetical protein